MKYLVILFLLVGCAQKQEKESWINVTDDNGKVVASVNAITMAPRFYESKEEAFMAAFKAYMSLRQELNGKVVKNEGKKDPKQEDKKNGMQK